MTRQWHALCGQEAQILSVSGEMKVLAMKGYKSMLADTF